MKKAFLSTLCLLVLTVTLPGKSTASEVKIDEFNVVLDSQGQARGGGSGYDNGQWYYYENTEWWNQWFYDDPYDPTRYKEIAVSGTIIGEPGSWATIVVNWTTGQWDGQDPTGAPAPPLPEDIVDLQHELALIVRAESPDYSEAYDGDVGETMIPIPFSCFITVPDYNPEWVSIDIQGAGIEVVGTIAHVCIPEPATIVMLGLGLAFLRRRKK